MLAMTIPSWAQSQWLMGLKMVKWSHDRLFPLVGHRGFPLCVSYCSMTVLGWGTYIFFIFFPFEYVICGFQRETPEIGTCLLM